MTFHALHRLRFTGLLLAGLLLVSRLVAGEINVFAAASLSDALTEIAALHKKNTSDTVNLNLAASSTLAVQIKAGAPADVFFSADEASMDQIVSLIDPPTRHDLLSNTLVIVVPNDSKLKISAPADLALPTVHHLALADPTSVPAGVYAKQYLQKIKVWADVSDRIIPAANVRATLAAVESGNAEAGLVYQTDALSSKKVRIAFAVPVAEGPVISYPVAAVKDGKNAAAAAKFLALLATPEARAVFVKYGFRLVPETH